MILYHLTKVRVIEGILKEGLKPFRCYEWERLLPNPDMPVIWFTDSIREKGSYLHPSRCLVQVDSKNLDTLKLKRTKHKGWWCYEGQIQAEFVSLVDWEKYRYRKPRFMFGLDAGVV